jgi:hypothetical protein
MALRVWSTDIVIVWCRRVWNIFWNGVFAADGCHASIRCFAGFGESIVAGVEVLSFLKPYISNRFS